MSDFETQEPRPDISDVMATFLERWSGTAQRREIFDELTALVNFERERCAKIAELHPEGYGGRSASEIIAAKIRSSE